MQPRLDYFKVLPEAMQTVRALTHYSATSGLEPLLLDLVKVRASQINGCAYCIDMHTKDARTKGETEQRLYGLAVWRETPYYTERERAALALTEVVTCIADGPISDELYEWIRTQFTEEELVKLMIAIAAINIWNRFATTFRTPPGSYQPNHFVAQAAREDEPIPNSQP